VKHQLSQLAPAQTFEQLAESTGVKLIERLQCVSKAIVECSNADQFARLKALMTARSDNGAQ
jgi:hypothetical protein